MQGGGYGGAMVLYICVHALELRTGYDEGMHREAQPTHTQTHRESYILLSIIVIE